MVHLANSQDRPQEISIEILFHLEELLVILLFHAPMLQLPACRLPGNLAKPINKTTCKRHEAIALVSEQSHASQWDYYLLTLETAV